MSDSVSDGINNDDSTNSDIIEVDDDNITSMVNYRGFSSALSWLRKYKEEPPEHLRGDITRDKHGIYFVVYWFFTLQNQIHNSLLNGANINNIIPKWMQHSPNDVDNNGWTTAMHWISTFKINVPQCFYHRSSIQNNLGRTAAMFYLMVTGEDAVNCEDEELSAVYDEDIPQWMIHNPKIKDKDGLTVYDYWIKYRKTEPPEWITISI